MADAPKTETKKPTETLTERLNRAIKERKKCSGTFRCIARYYRAGRLYEAGELITIEDEVPSRAFEPFDPDAPVRAAVPPPAPKAATPATTPL